MPVRFYPRFQWFEATGHVGLIAQQPMWMPADRPPHLGVAADCHALLIKLPALHSGDFRISTEF